MTLLIVDDEISAIEAVQKNLDWAQLPFTDVLTAANKAGAMELLGSQQVDILLSDIEMPMGSGLELLEWVNANCEGISCVFMTCHADFSYAQRAMRLGVADYVLKPLDFGKLQEVLQQTVSRQRQARRLQEVDSYWNESRRDTVRQFWKDFFTGDIAPTQESVVNFWQQKHMEFDLDAACLPVLLSVKQWEERTKEDQKLMAYALRNVADELFEHPGFSREVLPFSHNQILVIIRPRDAHTQSIAVEQELSGICKRFAAAAQEHLRVWVVCYVGKAVPICAVPEQLEALQVMDFNNVTLANRVLLLSRYVGYYHGHQGYSSEKLRQWRQLMRAGEYQGVYKDILRVVEDGRRNDSIRRQTLRNLDRDLLVLLYEFLDRHNIFMVDLFEDSTYSRLTDASAESLESFLERARYVLERLETYDRTATGRSDPVVKVKEYIDEHLDEELSVEDVASHVHLNADYLGRIFKRQAGSSISRFIIQCKVERAKWLMQHTQKPIGEVAELVGYYNYSSFNRVFSKETGMSPQEYKNSLR